MILIKAMSTVLIGFFCIKATGAPLETKIEKGMPFSQARKLLLKQNWKPTRTIRNTEHFAVDKALLEKNIVEVDFCTVDSFCVFRYTRHGQCLKIVAHGEELNTLTVSGWDSSCADNREHGNK